MPTTRADRPVHLPSRRVLSELPARVVTFLRATGTHAGIRGALARGGYTRADHEEGFRLLQAVLAFADDGLDPAEDEPARDAIARIGAWVETHFSRLRFTLERLHPEAVALFAGIESPELGEAVLALATLLERLDSLDTRAPVLATFAQRGVGRVLRVELAELVRIAQSAPDVDPAATVHESREAELLELYTWHTDWAGTARAVVRRKDHLILLGLAERKRRERAECPTGRGPEGSYATYPA